MSFRTGLLLGDHAVGVVGLRTDDVGALWVRNLCCSSRWPAVGIGTLALAKGAVALQRPSSKRTEPSDRKQRSACSISYSANLSDLTRSRTRNSAAVRGVDAGLRMGRMASLIVSETVSALSIGYLAYSKTTPQSNNVLKISKVANGQS